MHYSNAGSLNKAARPTLPSSPLLQSKKVLFISDENLKSFERYSFRLNPLSAVSQKDFINSRICLTNTPNFIKQQNIFEAGYIMLLPTDSRIQIDFYILISIIMVKVQLNITKRNSNS